MNFNDPRGLMYNLVVGGHCDAFGGCWGESGGGYGSFDFWKGMELEQQEYMQEHMSPDAYAGMSEYDASVQNAADAQAANAALAGGDLETVKGILAANPSLVMISAPTLAGEDFASIYDQLKAGLAALGLTGYTPLEEANGHIIFQFGSAADRDAALRALRALPGVVLEGPWGTFHNGQVGTPNADFRTVTGGGGLFSGHSMQITVFSGSRQESRDPYRGFRAYADLDRFNPYQGALGFLLHGFAEVLPVVFRGLVP